MIMIINYLASLLIRSSPLSDNAWWLRKCTRPLSTCNTGLRMEFDQISDNCMGWTENKEYVSCRWKKRRKREGEERGGGGRESNKQTTQVTQIWLYCQPNWKIPFKRKLLLWSILLSQISKPITIIYMSNVAGFSYFMKHWCGKFISEMRLLI